MIELKGIIPALTTPFTKEQDLDLTSFQGLIDTVIQDGVHGILVNGCTGESWALDDQERVTLFEAAVKQAAGRVPVVAGCGAICTKDVIKNVHMAETVGCDAVMIQPPSYVLITMEEVLQFFREIIRVTELPVMIYNIPRRTGITLTADIVDKLADEPNVIAIKESSKDWLVLSEIIRKVKDRINVLAGYASLLGLAAMSEGAVGFISASTPVEGRLPYDFYDAVIAGDLEKARKLQIEMVQFNKGFFGIGTFPAALKVALDMLGRPGGGYTRDPIKPLSNDQRAQVKELLTKANRL